MGHILLHGCMHWHSFTVSAERRLEHSAINARDFKDPCFVGGMSIDIFRASKHNNDDEDERERPRQKCFKLMTVIAFYIFPIIFFHRRRRRRRR